VAQFRTGRLQAIIALGLLSVPCALQAQQSAPASAPAPASVPDPPKPAPADPAATRPAPGTPASQDEQIDKRILGVLPNYRTAPISAESQPLTTHQKFTIALKDSFDWPVYFVSGAFAGLYQLENQNPSFGQGVKGYARRYATSFGDQTIGNMMTEAIMPTLLREDPRYFRVGSGGIWHRAIYAASRVMITRTDAGHSSFNFGEWIGNGATAAIGNLYYPQERSASDVWQRTYTQVATDAFSQELKEFWPDIKRRWFSHRGNTVADVPTSTSQH
jgi:hypothetical protein